MMGNNLFFDTIESMSKILNEFVSNESREFKFKIGHRIASSLSGFIAGVIVGSMIWLVVVYILRLF